MNGMPLLNLNNKDNLFLKISKDGVFETECTENISFSSNSPSHTVDENESEIR